MIDVNKYQLVSFAEKSKFLRSLVMSYKYVYVYLIIVDNMASISAN